MAPQWRPTPTPLEPTATRKRTVADKATRAAALQDERFVEWQAQRNTRRRFLAGFASLMAGYQQFETQAKADLVELDTKIAAYSRERN